MSQPVPYGAAIYAKDYLALAKFYEHVAGLTQREADEEYVLLEVPSFQLVILQIPPRIAANIAIDKPPRKRENTPIKLFLNVSNIEDARQAAKVLGGELNGPRRSGSSTVSSAAMASTVRAATRSSRVGGGSSMRCNRDQC